jgi:hypothetical protein
MTVREVHIIPEAQEWTVQINGQVLGAVHSNREDALAAARKVAQREKADLILHECDGTLHRVDDARFPLAGDEGAPSYW